METADCFLGRDPFRDLVLPAEARLERTWNPHGKRVQAPDLPVVGAERDMPVEVNEVLRPVMETSLLVELAAEGGGEIMVPRLDLAAHRDPEPAPGGRASEEEQLERRRGEEVAFDALLGNRSGGAGH
jgi:hypothetical protein